jgi:hypothetical protein
MRARIIAAGLLPLLLCGYAEKPLDRASLTLLESTRPSVENAVAMVLLDRAALPDAAAVEKTYRKAVPSTTLRLDKPQSDTLSYGGSGGRFAVVSLMPVPVPNGDADKAAQFSLSGINKWSLPKHHAHLVVVFRGSSKTKLASIAEELPFLAAVVKNTPSAVGVYFGATTQQPALVEQLAADPSPLSALMLVTGIIAGHDEAGRRNLLSKGMHSNFGLPELWLRTPQGPSDVEFFFDLLQLEAERGTPIPEGDTVGRNAQQKLPVHYRPSPIAGDPVVWTVDDEQ